MKIKVATNRITLLGLLPLAFCSNRSEQACDARVNDTPNQLLECTSGDGALNHLLVLQRIADDNGGIRAAGTQGYDQSAEYILARMEAAGYQVEIQPFTFVNSNNQEAPSTLEQITPFSQTYIEDHDFRAMGYTLRGDVHVQASVSTV